jgi:hypothetical protein
LLTDEETKTSQKMEPIPDAEPVDFFVVRIGNDIVGHVDVDTIFDENAYLQEVDRVFDANEDVTLHRVPRTATNVHTHQFLNQAFERQNTDASVDWTAWIQENPDAVALIQNDGSQLVYVAILRRLHWSSWPFLQALLSLCVENDPDIVNQSLLGSALDTTSNDRVEGLKLVEFILQRLHFKAADYTKLFHTIERVSASRGAIELLINNAPAICLALRHNPNRGRNVSLLECFSLFCMHDDCLRLVSKKTSEVIFALIVAAHHPNNSFPQGVVDHVKKFASQTFPTWKTARTAKSYGLSTLKTFLDHDSLQNMLRDSDESCDFLAMVCHLHNGVRDLWNVPPHFTFTLLQLDPSVLWSAQTGLDFLYLFVRKRFFWAT